MANDYDEDIYVQVVSDTVSQSVRDHVTANLKNLAVGREHNRQLGMGSSIKNYSFLTQVLKRSAIGSGLLLEAPQ